MPCFCFSCLKFSSPSLWERKLKKRFPGFWHNVWIKLLRWQVPMRGRKARSQEHPALSTVRSWLQAESFPKRCLSGWCTKPKYGQRKNLACSWSKENSRSHLVLSIFWNSYTVPASHTLQSAKTINLEHKKQDCSMAGMFFFKFLCKPTDTWPSYALFTSLYTYSSRDVCLNSPRLYQKQVSFSPLCFLHAQNFSTEQVSILQWWQLGQSWNHPHYCQPRWCQPLGPKPVQQSEPFLHTTEKGITYLKKEEHQCCRRR